MNTSMVALVAALIVSGAFGGAMFGGPLLDGALLGGPQLGGALQGGPLNDGALFGGPLLDGALLDGPLHAGALFGGPLHGGALLGGPLHGGALLDGEFAAPGFTAPQQATRAAPGVRTLTVYYFHRTIRCEGCLQIEKVARAAVTRTFGREMKRGRVAWRSVNLDEKGNEAFERRYRLQVQTLVLSEQIGQREVRWTRLDDAWDFQSDPVALDAYVVREVREYLSAHVKEH